MSNNNIWQNKAQRERSARKQAEELLEKKSLELYHAHQELKQLNSQLEHKIEQRTQQLSIAKQKADAANNAKSVFLATISHELRTPLNVILGMLDLSLKQNDLASKTQSFLQTAQNNTKSLHHLINDILDFSSLENHQLKLQEKTCNILDIVSEATESMGLKAQEKNLQLYCGLAQNIPQICHLDPVRVKQILLNILNNAIKFTDQGQVHVHIDFKHATKQYVIQISDTGPGIKADDLDRIFNQFYQASSNTPSKQFNQGLGLGLSICQSLLDKMQGQLLVESTQGQGSTFSIVLPYSKQEQNTLNVSLYQYDLQDSHITLYKLKTEALSLLQNLSTSDQSISCMDETCINFANKQSGAKALTSHLIFLKAKDLNNTLFLKYLDDYVKNHSQTQVHIIALSNIDHSLFFSNQSKDQTHNIQNILQTYSNIKIHGISLPLSPKKLFHIFNDIQNPTPKNQHQPQHIWQAQDRFKILLVEDHHETLVYMQHILKSWSFWVDTAIDGMMAYEKCQAQQYHLILTDQNMPNMTGLQLFQQIRSKLTAYNETPIILLSADPHLSNNYKQHGINHFISKPLEEKKLQHLLQHYANSTSNYKTPADNNKNVSQNTSTDSKTQSQTLNDLQKIYIEKRQEQILDLQQHLEDQDFKTLYRIGHNLKGSGLAYGFADVSRIGSRLEDSAQKQNTANIQNCIEDLKRWLQTVSA